jgi:hypothetical protein
MAIATARTPFLDSNSFSAEEPQEAPPPVGSSVLNRSPFLSVYEFNESEAAQNDPVREAYASLMNELHDEEFDEALYELECSARAMHDEQLAAGKQRDDADRLVAQHFLPLIRATEAAVDAVAREFASREQAGISEQEVEAFIQEYQPPERLDPEFENLFGGILRKVGRVVKSAAGKAWQGIKKVALGPLFNLIKTAFKEIMERVLNWAMSKIPEPLRPAAQLLAQKLGFGQAVSAPAPSSAGSADGAGSPVQTATGDNATSPQQELNEHIAAAMLAQDEAELELQAAQLSSASNTATTPVLAELEDARERFIQELESLGAEESAAPQIQNFLPAVIKALQVAVPIIGRERVVNWIAQPVAALIKKLIGPDQAPALSRAIVDAGLKLPPLNLELSEAETARLAPAAVAATVEETIRRVASLPDEVLNNQELLEGYTLEAFEQAAAANLPAVFSEATYRRRPDLLEAGLNAGWVLLPLRGPKRYKRCTRSFHVNISPHLAEEVESFEGATLAEHLQDQLGLEEGEEAEGQVYLYEALPGTTVADIARGERENLGPGQSDEANAEQLHPLTSQAAAIMLGKPGLGRAFPAYWRGRKLAAGQRLFGLAGRRRLLMIPGHHRRPRRRMRVYVTLDSVQDQVRVCAFISEVRAQKLAARLRQAPNLGLITAGFQGAIRGRLDRIFGGHAPSRLRVVHAALPPGRSPASALQNLPPIATQTFVAKLQAWLVQGFAEFIKVQAPRVIAATENAADGITFVFTLEHPPGLKELGQAMVDRAAAAGAIAEAISKGTPPAVRVEVFAGRRCV